MTDRQREILEYLISKIREQGFPPSIREIGQDLGISSLRGVTSHLDALAKKGYIQRDRHARGIRVMAGAAGNPLPENAVELPVVGAISAGQPILAVEEIDETLVVDERFTRGEGCFALRIEGDSITGAGILDGDFVVVRQQPNANDGDVVAVGVGDKATVKRFFRDTKNRVIRLEPENPLMETIVISEQEENVHILGKVVGVLRRLG
ncbi:MAG: transcriptional repressor LexA [Candidatus Omnitrophica bacterium]|nr:transcriptional repressor LexA [Candidatus Omnitrophota bacterium]